MAEHLPPIVADERIVWRKRVLRGGKVVYGEEGEFTLDCLIHDISESGARISLKPNEFIPTNFFLVDVQKGVAHEAQATWVRVMKSVPQFGVKFGQTHTLESCRRGKLRFLHRFAGKQIG
jgi:hypothetical protein